MDRPNSSSRTAPTVILVEDTPERLSGIAILISVMGTSMAYVL